MRQQTAPRHGAAGRGRRGVRRQPEAGDRVRAICGCQGVVNETRDGQYPVVSVVVQEPCGGHPARLKPGVIERFPPEGIDITARAVPEVMTA